MRRRTFREKGFTLVEIVLVIVLIGILAAIIVPKFAGQTDKAKIAATKINLESIRSAIRMYQADHNGALPNSIGDLIGTYLPNIPEERITPSISIAITVDGNSGWVYDKSSGKVSVNLLNNDADGTPYSSY